MYNDSLGINVDGSYARIGQIEHIQEYKDYFIIVTSAFCTYILHKHEQLK